MYDADSKKIIDELNKIIDGIDKNAIPETRHQTMVKSIVLGNWHTTKRIVKENTKRTQDTYYKHIPADTTKLHLIHKPMNKRYLINFKTLGYIPNCGNDPLPATVSPRKGNTVCVEWDNGFMAILNAKHLNFYTI